MLPLLASLFTAPALAAPDEEPDEEPDDDLDDEPDEVDDLSYGYRRRATETAFPGSDRGVILSGAFRMGTSRHAISPNTLVTLAHAVDVEVFVARFLSVGLRNEMEITWFGSSRSAELFLDPVVTAWVLLPGRRAVVPRITVGAGIEAIEYDLGGGRTTIPVAPNVLLAPGITFWPGGPWGLHAELFIRAAPYRFEGQDDLFLASGLSVGVDGLFAPSR